MYEMYVKERQGAEYYSDYRGFFTYRVENGIFMTIDLFIVPQFRERGVGKEYARKIEELAKEFECTEVQCTTCPDALNWEQSDKYIRNNGYNEFKRDDTFIYYMKEL